MTAEIAILNKGAIALAADSAVTVTGRSEKIYNTVNKLFMLSKHAPVGVMVYSAAELLTIPVETVIKHYRSVVLEDNVFDELDDYAINFITYLATDDQIISNEHREHDLRIVIFSMLKKIEEVAGTFAEKKKPSALKDRIDQSLKNIKKRKKSLSFQKDSEGMKKFISEAVAIWAEQEVVKETLDHTLFDTVCALIFETLTREGQVEICGSRVDGVETGIVFAGFGKREAFPVLVSIEFVFTAFGYVKYEIKEKIAIGNDCESEIVGFAQTDQIDSFINGHPRSYELALHYILRDCFDVQIDELTANANMTREELVSLRGSLESIRDAVKDKFADKLARVTVWERQVLKDSLRGLPKEELAMIAESLISLTIAKRRASPDSETVGPPIDVAVISKGDGFIWMKRKHYFDIGLNLDFRNRQFRGTNEKS